ncbi:MAG: DUF488 family protein [Gammaproteobacteria bacterium]|nr:DUF488 family protein [Gammaproteobacteria bacterium]
MARSLRLKRVYAAPADADGFRILVDRIWPRGLTRNKARIDHWARGIAPSTRLRQWFGHEPGKWPEFKKRYFAELRRQREAMAELRKILKVHTTVTLVFAARDQQHNNAVAIRSYLRH